MKAPLWYTAEEVHEWLKRDGHPKKEDLPVFLATHLQKAFEKGWDKTRVCKDCVEEFGDPNNCIGCPEESCAVERSQTKCLVCKVVIPSDHERLSASICMRCEGKANTLLQRSAELEEQLEVHQNGYREYSKNIIEGLVRINELADDLEWLNCLFEISQELIKTEMV